jgi:hypothetical protein
MHINNVMNFAASPAISTATSLAEKYEQYDAQVNRALGLDNEYTAKVATLPKSLETALNMNEKVILLPCYKVTYNL